MHRNRDAADLLRAQRAAEQRAAEFARAAPARPPRRRRAAWALALTAAVGLPLAVWTLGWQPEPQTAPAPAPRGTAFPWDRATPTPATDPLAAAGGAEAASAPAPVAAARPCAGDACDADAMRRAAEAATAASRRPELVGAFGVVSDWTAWWAAQATDASAAGAPLPVLPAVGGPPPAPSAATTDDGRPE